MGKRRKRLTMEKYAKKYAKKRQALGLGKASEPPATISKTVEAKEEKPVNALKQIEPELETATKKKTTRKKKATSKTKTTNKTTTETKTKTTRRRRTKTSS